MLWTFKVSLWHWCLFFHCYFPQGLPQKVSLHEIDWELFLCLMQPGLELATSGLQDCSTDHQTMAVSISIQCCKVLIMHFSIFWIELHRMLHLPTSLLSPALCTKSLAGNLHRSSLWPHVDSTLSSPLFTRPHFLTALISWVHFTAHGSLFVSGFNFQPRGR